MTVSDAIKAQVASMMKWQSRSLAPVVVLLTLALVQIAAKNLLETSTNLTLLLRMATLCALLVAIVLGAIAVWHIFQAGRMAFGLLSGLIYAVLTIALPFWPGLFVIPHMVRLDIQRHFGVEPDSGETRPR